MYSAWTPIRAGEVKERTPTAAGQLNKMLQKANASIHDFAQVRLLEFKKSEVDYEQQFKTAIATIPEQKGKWWHF